MICIHIYIERERDEIINLNNKFYILYYIYIFRLLNINIYYRNNLYIYIDIDIVLYFIDILSIYIYIDIFDL